MACEPMAGTPVAVPGSGPSVLLPSHCHPPTAYCCPPACHPKLPAGLTLPLQYNCQAEQSLEGNLTVGGLPPKIVHFTERKPFHGPIPGAPGHHFLCSAEELAARPAAVAAAAAAVVGAAAVQGARQQQEQQRRGEAAAAAASGGGVPGALAAGG